jgi:hypothetical protein
MDKSELLERLKYLILKEQMLLQDEMIRFTREKLALNITYYIFTSFAFSFSLLGKGYC